MNQQTAEPLLEAVADMKKALAEAAAVLHLVPCLCTGRFRCSGHKAQDAVGVALAKAIGADILAPGQRR